MEEIKGHDMNMFETGLFHKIIVASGSGINSWSTQSPERSSKFSRNLARLLGASEDDINDTAKRVQYLRKADPEEMSRRRYQVMRKEVGPILHAAQAVISKHEDDITG